MDLIARGLAVKAGSADNFLSNVDRNISNVDIQKTSDGKLTFNASGVGLDTIVSWDGQSTPVVDDIPEGVSVQYQGTTYVGTLAASQATVSIIFLIYAGSQNNNYYEEYLTVKKNDEYIWELIGTASGGGISSDDIDNIVVTNVDPGVGSELASGTMLLVYEE